MKKLITVLSIATTLICLSITTAKAQNSKMTGLSLGLDYHGASHIYTNAEGKQEEVGNGLGLRLGLGFRNRVMLVVNLDATALDTGVENDVLAHFDIALNYYFRRDHHKIRPIVGIGFTGVANGFQVGGDELIWAGAGWHLNLGSAFHITRRLAFEAQLITTIFDYTDATINNQAIAGFEPLSATSGRFKLGLRYTLF